MITIRRAEPHDIAQLALLFDAYRVFYRKPSDLAGAESFLLERVERRESVIFVAEDGILVGFTQLYPQFSSTRMNRYWLLNDLFVAPGHRGMGISRELIKAAKEHVKVEAALGLLLETEKTNEIGHKLYPSAGFSAYQDTDFYWWENE